MRVMAQVAMVMNLDKCIGCHTCSVTCKQTWTNRPGVEYVYFNNVETKPGAGYPRRYEDQEEWKGGWTLDRKGRLELKAGGRVRRLLSMYYNPHLPPIDDYGEPWTYDYETVIAAPPGTQNPSAQAISALTGRGMSIEWGSNFDDDLAGAPDHAAADPNLAGLEERVRMEFEQVFMFYLPRICEHCLNPSCVASCPSGALYKREEDGIVLVDQNRCRGWRFCVSGCPYKKVYFNHRTGKAEKCTFCFPRIEAGEPTICSESCVGRLRYLGVLLYDADAVPAAAATPDPRDLYEAQLSVFLDPEDPRVRAAAERQGVHADWVDAARRSPVHALAVRHRVALPLHPEYRTMPMVWYIPPLSPVADLVQATGYDHADRVFATIESLRVPIEYLANLFTAGDTEVVRGVLRKLAAVRAFMRAVQLGQDPGEDLPGSVGMTAADIDDLYRLLAIAKYDERYVIPRTHAEDAGEHTAQHMRLACSLEGDGGPGMGGHGPEGRLAGSTPGHGAATFRGADGRLHANLLGWDGAGEPPPHLFPGEDTP
ncbi:nitrate reductase subunit beta [Sphaerisporangium siamense]|uniref:Nitrate reductase beta subunit n=1 Tax=Sphaerisporangium siamense TaxID=795645 RepID=A0A7W7DFI3_9ACTN|nr:nitrate reductase subunit beta [Sphaerisporangium siamense]MBB4705914.1 nitrate reductase beta subunit [Sphaerisporangium siamense]GII82691.1 nitrate reductase subunit beta [Sphaerisporangium siamense]